MLLAEVGAKIFIALKVLTVVGQEENGSTHNSVLTDSDNICVSIPEITLDTRVYEKGTKAEGFRTTSRYR